MIFALAAAAAVAAAPVSPLTEAARALDAGRPDQARVMIAAAVRAGASGPAVDRLLADLSFVQRDWPTAFARYQALLKAAPGSAYPAQRAGIAALNMGSLDRAVPLLEQAVAAPAAGWRAWNARAVAADWQGDWAKADEAYARAESLSPGNARVLNNKGWSALLRGDWAGAAAILEQAAALAPTDARIAANLDLARSAVAQSLPDRRTGEANAAFAARLNDAGVVALRGGDRDKAVAAFARALEASDEWYGRAANNLVVAEGTR